MSRKEERALLQEIEADLQRSPRRMVLYLEGKTDVPIFFGLLGVSPPGDDTHDGVLVRGLSERTGSGSVAVRARVEAATRNGYPGAFGVTDGDGRALDELRACFDPPFAGPLFSWKAYCIENLLAKTAWPGAWGTPPDWTQVLLDHAPYVALNRMHLELQESLATLRLRTRDKPRLDQPLKTVAEVAAALARDKHLIADYDAETRFQAEVGAFSAAVAASLDAGHAMVDGKWLVDVFAPRRLAGGATPERCRDEWIASASASGGLGDVRGLWERITGRAP